MILFDASIPFLLVVVPERAGLGRLLRMSRFSPRVLRVRARASSTHARRESAILRRVPLPARSRVREIDVWRESASAENREYESAFSIYI